MENWGKKYWISVEQGASFVAILTRKEDRPSTF
jgi:hypothetical protein